MTARTDTFPQHRLIFLAAVLVGFGLVLSWQLVRWHIVERERFIDIVSERPRDAPSAPPRRGQIVDRRGHLLAVDTIGYQITATPNWIKTPEEVAQRLAPLLQLPVEELIARLAQDSSWVLLSPNVSREVGETIRGWDVRGVHVDPRPGRGYPEGKLAAHLLGFVNDDRQGFYGIEGYYDHLLLSQGQTDREAGEASPLGAFPLDPAELADGVNPDLCLAMDRMIQHIAEEELEAAIIDHNASGGTVIVMDPRSGAILAAASRPVYHPQHYAQAASQELWSDPTVSDTYEPGSVFKIVTVAAAIDTATATVEQIFDDRGFIEVGGQKILNSDRKARGEVTLTDAMVHSLNTVMAEISMQLGPETFYAYVQRFGFGHRTGVDLSGESRGQLKLPTDAEWHESDLGTNSFGQGLAVTPLQMAAAVAAIANDGTMMVPYAVAEVTGKDQTWPRHPTVARQVVTPETAKKVTEILIQAAEKGAPRSQVAGYTVAGKSGTAQIPIPGGYDPNGTIASFVGFVPADDPQLLILVKVDRPTDTQWGAAVAAPVFSNIAQRLLVMMNIPPDAE
jgi:cell division protein FtsI/penicillin-binding protein 2